MTLNYQQELNSLLDFYNLEVKQGIGADDLLPKLTDYIKNKYQPKDAIELLTFINQQLQQLKLKHPDDLQQQHRLTNLFASIASLFINNWNKEIPPITNIDTFVNYFNNNNFPNDNTNTICFLQLSSIDNLFKLGKENIQAIILVLSSKTDSLNDFEFGKIFELKNHVNVLNAIEKLNKDTDLIDIIKNDKNGIFLDAILSNRELLRKCGLLAKNTSDQWINIRTTIYQNLELAIATHNKFTAGRIAYAFAKHFPNPLSKTIDKTPSIRYLSRYFKTQKKDQSSKIDALSNENTHTELGPRTLVPHVLPQAMSEEEINKINQDKENHNTKLLYRLEELNKKLKIKKYHTLWDLIYAGLKLKLKNNLSVDNLNILNISLQALHEVVKENGEPNNIGKLDFVVYQDQITTYVEEVKKNLTACNIITSNASIKVTHKFISTYDHNIINPKTGKPHSTDYQKEIINAANETSKYDVIKIECHSGMERSASFINNMILVKTTKDCTNINNFQTPCEICQATNDNRHAAKKLPQMGNKQIQFIYSMQADVINHPDIINNPNLLDDKNNITNTDEANKKKELLFQAFANKPIDVVDVIAENARLYFSSKSSKDILPFDNVLFEIFARNWQNIDKICKKINHDNQKDIKQWPSFGKWDLINIITVWPRFFILDTPDYLTNTWLDKKMGKIFSNLKAAGKILDEEIKSQLNQQPANRAHALNSQNKFHQIFLPNLFFNVIRDEKKRAAFIKDVAAEQIANIVNLVFSSKNKDDKKHNSNIIAFIETLYTTFPKDKSNSTQKNKYDKIIQKLTPQTKIDLLIIKKQQNSQQLKNQHQLVTQKIDDAKPGISINNADNDNSKQTNASTQKDDDRDVIEQLKKLDTFMGIFSSKTTIININNEVAKRLRPH